MKIAIAQITTDPGKLKANSSKIATYIQMAKDAGAQIVAFPELALTGYAIMDLAFNSEFIEDCKKELQELASSVTGITAIVGFVDSETSKNRPGTRPLLYNSAAIIENGKIIAIQDKTLLPDYDIFSEQRYFASARSRDVISVGGETIGVQICEDLWDKDYPIKVSEDLISKKASTIINISASPFHVGKLRERTALISKICREKKVNFIYTNLVGSFDGFVGETVFDGQSLAFNSSGEVMAQAQAFQEELLVVDTLHSTTQKIYYASEEQDLFSALTLGISDYFRRLNFKKAFIGLSGGIDSALVAALACEALGPHNVVGVTMPSHITGDDTKSDALLLANNLSIKCFERPIHAEYQAWEKEFQKAAGHAPQSLTKQNKQARIRGSILMEYTNENRNSLVISTGNKTELALGYCTLYGDMCGGLAAISDLSKERVYKLSRYINSIKSYPVIPSSIIERVPTAELEIGQTDRDNLPADYPLLSPLVDRIIEDQLTANELYQLYPKDIVDRTFHLINCNEFKRRQAAPGIRVTKRAFGIGRRIPIGNPLLA